MAYNAINNSVFAYKAVGDGSTVAQLNDNIEDTRTRVAQNETDIAAINASGFKVGCLGLRILYNPGGNQVTVTPKLNVDNLTFTATATVTSGASVDTLAVIITPSQNIGSSASATFGQINNNQGDYFDFEAGGTAITFQYKSTTNSIPTLALNIHVFYDRSELA